MDLGPAACDCVRASKNLSGVWWHMPVIPAIGRLRQGIMSSRLACELIKTLSQHKENRVSMGIGSVA
jgi:hypothetical protein